MGDKDTTRGFIDETDVEGHAARARDAEPEGLRQREVDSEGLRQRDGDVEGHRRDAEPDGYRMRVDDGPDGVFHRLASVDGQDDDVEGHRMLARDAGPDGLRTRPSTQGELRREAPGDNPHGD
jgi:hypothetical protein